MQLEVSFLVMIVNRINPINPIRINPIHQIRINPIHQINPIHRINQLYQINAIMVHPIHSPIMYLEVVVGDILVNMDVNIVVNPNPKQENRDAADQEDKIRKAFDSPIARKFP